MRRKIKNENVILMILQRRFQRQQFPAAGLVPMAQNNRGRAPQPGEKPPLARPYPPRHLERQHFRTPRKARHVDFRTGALRLHNAIHQEPRDRRSR